MRHYYCTKCGLDLSTKHGRDFDFNGNNKIVYKDTCPECGGIIDAGFPKQFVNVGYGEHERVLRSLGVLDEDLPAAKKLHPQAEWKKVGNSWCPIAKTRTDRQLLCKQASKCSYYDFD